MNKKYIYTVGYTLFQQGNTIDVEKLFNKLKEFNIDFLVDVRSVPFSKQYPQCNADNMKVTGKRLGIPYMNMLRLIANKKSSQKLQIYSLSMSFFL